ncbi:OB-fold nucleic acid binding domain-containing protein [Nocardioides nanhaiensis]|uniref:OB-fold nucleic acid binding domain-containing protein n=1 Tax=Nocardioides nanhaiensis TaxID=1476871 RepID=A0ABP8WIX7_9ACTN
MAPQEGGRLRRRLVRWTHGGDDAAQERRPRREEGTPEERTIAEAPDRTPVVLRGTLSSVTLRPRGGVPALEAELDDGSGSLTVVWLGRRRIAGVGPGVAMTVSGRVGVHDGVRTLYNPRYELLP